jgi:hypothetical protein
LPFRLDLFTFYEGTSPTITYEKFNLFEKSLREEIPRASSPGVDFKEIENRLKKILQTYDLDYTQEIQLVLISATPIGHVQFEIFKNTLRNGTKVGAWKQPCKYNLSYIKLTNEDSHPPIQGMNQKMLNHVLGGGKGDSTYGFFEWDYMGMPEIISTYAEGFFQSLTREVSNKNPYND